MKKYNLLFSLLSLTPILAKAEAPQTLPPVEIIDLEFEPPARDTFVQFDPLSLSIGAGVRRRIEGDLKGREHSVRFSPGFSKEFWGIVSYKYARLTYLDASPDSNYNGIGFKVGMLAHHAPFADIQYIKGWQYASGPFKWGQLEINALPIVIGAIGVGTMITDTSGLGGAFGAALLGIGLVTAISFNLAF